MRLATLVDAEALEPGVDALVETPPLPPQAPPLPLPNRPPPAPEKQRRLLTELLLFSENNA